MILALVSSADAGGLFLVVGWSTPIVSNGPKPHFDPSPHDSTLQRRFAINERYIYISAVECIFPESLVSRLLATRLSYKDEWGKEWDVR